jgi:hypothetical protein
LLFLAALVLDALFKLLQLGLEHTNLGRRVGFRDGLLREDLLREDLARRNQNAANKNPLE